MHVTINVFFSGTGHRVAQSNTLVHVLKEHLNDNTDRQKTIAFDGCGVTHGWRGVVFARGLDEQCQQVIAEVEAEIKKGNTVSLNAYGHSRGAHAALMLAEQLGAIDPNVLDVNLALLDPVPGNFITTSTLDLFDISLAKKTMDLRECRTLKRVLALYPNEPLPTLAVHAPLFSLYPAHTMVEEDIIAGCHAGAQFQQWYGEEINFPTESFITFARVVRFMQTCGSEFKPFPHLKINRLANLMIDNDHLDDALRVVYQSENKKYRAENYRDCHSATGRYIKTKNNAQFFNRHHQRLAGAPQDNNNARLTIEESNGPLSLLKRAMVHYPKTWQTLKWSLLITGLACLLFFTSGLGAIPVLGALTAQLGLAGLPLLMLAVGVALTSGWYGVVKPVLQWFINRFVYPYFQMRDNYTVDKPLAESPQLLVSSLNVTPTETCESAPVLDGVQDKKQVSYPGMYRSIFTPVSADQRGDKSDVAEACDDLCDASPAL